VRTSDEAERFESSQEIEKSTKSTSINAFKSFFGKIIFDVPLSITAVKV